MADSTFQVDQAIEQPHVVSPKGKRRLKRGCQIGCLVILLLAIAPFVVRYVLVRQAERHLAEVKANLPFELIAPEDIPDWLGPMPADEDNAAPLYDKITELMEEILAEEIEPAVEDEHEGEEEEETDDEVLTVDGRLDRLLTVWGIYEPDDDEEDLPPRDVAEARRFLDRFKEVFALRDQAVTRRFCQPERDWSDYFSLLGKSGVMSGLLTLAHLTMLEAIVDCHAGNAVAACKKVAAVFKISHHMRQQPFFIRTLVALKIHEHAYEGVPVLLATLPSNEVLANEFKSIFAFDCNELAVRATQLETIAASSVFEGVIEGSAAPTKMGGMKRGPGRAQASLLRWYFLNDHAIYLEFMGQQAEIAALPVPQMLARWKMLDAGLVDKVRPYPISSIMILCVSDLGLLAARGEARGHMVSNATNICRFKATVGHYPAKLADLPNAGDLPMDPFSGKPFGYRRTADGFLLWSIGEDLTDNGGKTPEDLGFDPGDYKSGGDLVFRVPPKVPPKVDTGPAKP